MKVRKMERAENSDLDTSLATVNMRNIFREKKFRRKVPFKYANWRTQLGKEIWLTSLLQVDFLAPLFIFKSINRENFLKFGVK